MSPLAPLGSLARFLVRALVKFYYVRIEVTGGDRIPRTGPVLLVANHPNSLFDPVLLGVAARRPLALMAKAPLFEIPIFGALLRAFGMVPAYRGSDDAKQVSKNLDSLAAAARRIAAGGALGIFPEGKSHDAPQLALVRSGAARLAMQALAAGAEGLQVVPVGLNYERKERFRTAVWIAVGEPVDATAWLAAHEGDEHRAMRTLTTELNTRLKAQVLHIDELAWEPLVADLEALLPAAGYAGSDGIAALHRRKAAMGAINHFHRVDRPRAEAVAAQVRAHGEALRAAGVAADARLLGIGPARLAAMLVRTGVGLALGLIIGFFGALHHVLPYGIVRLIAGRIPTPGRMTLALNRLLLSVPVYAAWYAFVAWRMSLYFLPWVVWTWIALMPFAGLVALGTGRCLRVALPLWWAEVRLAVSPRRRAALRASQNALVKVIAELGAEWAKVAPAPGGPAPRVRLYRPPLWLNLTLGAASLAAIAALGAWLLRDRPVEFLVDRAPALHDVAPVELTAQMESDERGLVAVIGGLEELETRFRRFEAELLAGRRSYYRQEDDDEMRRMLTTFLTYRSALLRTVWRYQRHAELADEPTRLRALLLHYTAAALAYDYSARFVKAFAGQTEAQRKLNEAEPRWDLPAGTYDRIRSNLANMSHRAWLEAGWKNYRATLPRWEAAGLRAGAPHALFHGVIARAAKNTAGLAEELFAYKVDTALAEVVGFAKGNYYRASSAVSTLIGDTKLRAPRSGAPLITPALLERLRPMLRPGDILIERRNWYLSNAFLPGYWPHSALYVGTADDVRALGLADDPRVAPHLARFAAADAAGHVPAIIEAISEGVVFTTVEHSIGEADAVAVLRPRLAPEQVREVVARAFGHAGKPYDFDFDFFSSDKLVCTEVVYRACNGLVDFPLVEILGRKTLPAVEIVRYWTTPEGAAKLEFVAFVDGDEAAGEARWSDAATLQESIGRPALTWLQ